MINPNVITPKRNHLKRNGFPLGFESYFSSPLGLLKPCYVQDVIPGDYLDVNVSNFTRTKTLNTAAFARLNEEVNFFFVPMACIWRWFPNMITGMKEQHSSYCPDGSSVIFSMPYITGTQIATLLKKSGANDVDLFGFKLSFLFHRIINLLGFPCKALGGDSGHELDKTLAIYDTTINPNAPYANVHLNPYRLFAYLHIYNDFYRNTQWEFLDAHNYNIDDIPAAGKIPDERLYSAFLALAQCYANMYKDQFTSVLPNPLFALPTQLQPRLTATDSLNPPFTSEGNMVSGHTGISGTPAVVSLSAQSIRALLATEKLSLLTNLAGKTFRDQLLARYGELPSRTDMYECRWIGKFDSKIGIGEITSTATASDGDGNASRLGEIAGKGVGGSNGHFTFKASDHGVIIGIHSVRPNVCYDASGIDHFNKVLDRSDFFLPEYEDLGLEPLTADEVSDVETLTPTTINNVLGYRARYSAYKSRVSRCYGQFASDGVDSSWVAPYRPRPLSMAGLFTYAKYKVCPLDLNPICAVLYAGDDRFDQFMHHYRFDVKAVRNMSAFGIPHI